MKNIYKESSSQKVLQNEKQGRTKTSIKSWLKMRKGILDTLV